MDMGPRPAVSQPSALQGVGQHPPHTTRLMPAAPPLPVVITKLPPDIASVPWGHNRQVGNHWSVTQEQRSREARAEQLTASGPEVAGVSPACPWGSWDLALCHDTQLGPPAHLLHWGLLTASWWGCSGGGGHISAAGGRSWGWVLKAPI